MKKTHKLVFLALFLNLLTNNASAQCSIGTGSYNAGSYDPISSNSLNTNTSIIVNCNITTNITLTASGGNSNNPQSRYLVNDKNEKLYYNIYLNNEGYSILGDGISTSKYSGNNGVIPIYIKFPSQQIVGIGQYYDNILITVDF